MRRKLRAFGIALGVCLLVSGTSTKAEAEYKTYTATAYCACSKCCGKSDGITATGTKALQGRTIAVDKSIIPLGSTVLVYIEDELYGIFIAEDTGGGIKQNKIDIYFENHQDARKFGVKEVKIVIVDAKG